MVVHLSEKLAFGLGKRYCSVFPRDLFLLEALVLELLVLRCCSQNSKDAFGHGHFLRQAARPEDLKADLSYLEMALLDL